MNNEPCMKDLYELVLKLNDKIDRLETIIKSNNCSFTIDTPPATDIIEWTKNSAIIMDDMDVLYNSHCIDAMKKFILRNHNTSPIPIMFKKNTLYVYEVSGWIKFSEEHLSIMVRDIWCKFLSIHMQIKNDMSIEETVRDYRMKHTLEMRLNIYDVKKNRAELLRWIKNIVMKN